MTRRKTPSVSGPVGATAATEPLWAIAYPAFFAITLGYGLFAVLKPIVQLVGPADPNAPADATGAQLFGLLVTVALVGALRTVFARRDGLEMFGAAAFTFMMLVYFAFLTVLIAGHDGNTRPGSSFVPLGFGWFPFVRAVVIGRDRKRRRRVAA